MLDTDSATLVDDAINLIDESSNLPTDGRWLEDLTAAAAPHIKEWDVVAAWKWAEWDEREERFPGTTNQDVGIDVVAKRRSDGEYIAIQCKSRQLDANGRGSGHQAKGRPTNSSARLRVRSGRNAGW